MKELLIILTIFILNLNKFSNADMINHLSTKSASLLDFGIHRLEHRLKDLSERRGYPYQFSVANVILARNSIQISVSTKFTKQKYQYNTKNEAIDGCRNWILYIRENAGYNTSKNEFYLGKVYKADISSFAYLFNPKGSGFGLSNKALEDLTKQFLLYCSATYKYMRDKKVSFKYVSIMGRINSNSYEFPK